MRIFYKPFTERTPQLVVLFIIFAVSLSMIGCRSESEKPEPATQDQNLIDTQVALAIQQTAIAQAEKENSQATADALQATIDFQQAQLNQAPTNTPEIIIQTPVPVTDTPQPTVAPPTEPPPTQPPVESFEDWMKSASILLYDDMNRYETTFRFTKRALDGMGLSYVDVGDAKGLLKTQMLQPPTVEGWDLIIIAAESKSGVQGEFFTYTVDALRDGSSVVLEVWYLDSVVRGAAGDLLAMCGVEFEEDWSMVPPREQIMWPLDDTHPVLRVPNSNLRFTDVTSFWGYTWDIGDLMRIPIGGSDAQLLVGLNAKNKQNSGTVTVCVDDRLILQTFSSHQLTWDVMRLVWENYIYNALRARYDYLH